MHRDGDVETCGALLSNGGPNSWCCTGIMEERMAAPRVKTIVRGNADYAERERARLTQRSNEHWNRQGKDEAHDRQQMQIKKIEKALG